MSPALRFSLRVALPALIAVVASDPARAWGANGHRIVATIALEHLGDDARREIGELVGPESLVDVSTWADDVKSDPAWEHADPWHYVSVADGGDPRLAEPVPGGDILRALDRFVGELAERGRPRAERAQALRFVVHLVGDLHQPLHVGRAEDRGGNHVEVEWFGRPTNLHWVWDTGLQAASHLSYTEHAERIRRRFRGATAGSGDPLDWARESVALRPRLYELPAGTADLGFELVYELTPILEERLCLAGLRLAALLEETLVPAPPEPRPVLVGLGVLGAVLLLGAGARRR